MITFITVKGNSVRCPRKNQKLLPYVLEQISNYLDVVVITDDNELKRIAEKYNVSVFMETKDIQISEFNSIYNYLEVNNKLDTVDEFLYLPVTQPFRSNELIMKIAYSNIYYYDFATTYTKVPDRRIFLLNDDNTFKYDSYERKGSLCNDIKMIDGYGYKIKTDFLKRVIASDNINHTFWNESKIKFIENNSKIFLDVDTPDDLKLFNILKEKPL